jgi:hypothetical protein
MSPRIRDLIPAAAICEFGPPFLCISKRVLKPFTGAEMVIHIVLCGLLAAAMLVQNAGGKVKSEALLQKSIDGRVSAYEVLQFWMDIAVMFSITALYVSPFPSPAIPK